MLNTKTAFTIRFPEGHYAPAVRVDPNTNRQHIIAALRLLQPCPTLFISGGASLMTKEHIRNTREIILRNKAEIS